MNEFDIAIIGGGPAGLMGAVGSCEDSNHYVAIFEKTDSLAKKLLLTGNGRCNITNNKPIKKLLNLFNEKNFLKHSFYTLTNEKLLNIFESKGLNFIEENDQRIFPETNKSSSILDVFNDYLNDYNVKTFLNYPVHEIRKENEKFILNNEYKALKIIISTGGITFPQTGSSGDGYKLSKTLNHDITKIKYGLVPLISNDSNLNKLAGTILYNVLITYKSSKNKYSYFGDVLISHIGLSGPPILNISNDISKSLDYNILDRNMINFDKVVISVDFCHNFTFEELNNKIIKDISLKGKVKLKNYLKYYLTNKFIDFFLNSINLDGNIILSSLNKKDKNKLISNLKGFNFNINGFNSKLSNITIGGININQINSKTMESKVNKGLYFAGEILEPVGLSGGYNLKIALSTGFLAGKSASESIRNI